MDAFYRLWFSTVNFHHRFRGSDVPTLLEGLRAFWEEVVEFMAAAMKRDRQEMAEEFVDILVTLIGLALSVGLTYPELRAAMSKVIKKNDAKNHETHYLNLETGKITRRKPRNGHSADTSAVSSRTAAPETETPRQN